MTDYVIALKPGVTADAVSAIKSEAAGDTRQFEIGDKTVVVGEFDAGVAASLRDRDDVAYVEEDQEVQALTVDPEPRNVEDQAEDLPWGVDRVDADEVDETGAGVDVAVIDTGIDATHEDLSANLGEGIAVVECGSGEGEPDCSEPWDDDNMHGTHVAGTIGAVASDVGVVGVAPEVTLHAVKVLGSGGSGSFSGVAEGITRAADAGWSVQNMSLGAPSGAQVVRDAVAHAASQGVTIVCAAGNSGPCTDCVGYPAAYDECIAVSATDDQDGMAEFTSQGPQVDVAGPGADVLSSLPDDAYGELSGTSMASPHVAGGAAILAAQGHGREAIRQRLTSGAEDLGHAPELQGSGLLDVPASLSEEPPTAPTAGVMLVLEQEAPQRGNIEATVIEQGSENPLQGATVAIDGPVADSKQTTSDGMATFADIPIGEYTVNANKDGYNSDSASVVPDDFQ